MLFVLIFCTVTVFGQDVSQSLAVDIATQYYEQVKNDNLSEYISTIKSYNLSKISFFCFHRGFWRFRLVSGMDNKSTRFEAQDIVALVTPC